LKRPKLQYEAVKGSKTVSCLNARKKNKKFMRLSLKGADARASKRAKVASFNSLPQPGLSHLKLPFSFDLPAPTKHLPSLYVFGTNGEGQLGLGLDDDDDDEIREPRLVEALPKMLGRFKLEDIDAAFGMHSLAVASNGKIWSWGSNDSGALGRTTDADKDSAKKKEAEPGLVEGLPAGYRATRVYGSDVASVAVSEQGLLHIWGQFRVGPIFVSRFASDTRSMTQSAEGEIPFDGIAGHPSSQPSPIIPAALARVKFASVAAGANHFLGLDIDGEVWTWGSNSEHVLGRELRGRSAQAAGLTPRKIHLKHIVAVAACMYTSFAINKEGHVYAWGSNAFTQFVPFLLTH
jgi:regulator of chromosome condensation